MFEGCAQLQSIILSNFKSSKITSMNNIFKGCSNLKFLDISNCDNLLTSLSSSMFNNDISNLEYINIYNVILSGNLAAALKNELNNKDNLIVCQKNQIITNDNAIYACCNYNNDNSKCEFPNYMIVKYKAQAEYNNGFQINTRTGYKICII